jgi:hypothetical protein
MYTCIHNLLAVHVVAFIHDKHEIKVHCTVMGVKSLLYLHCNYCMILFETFQYSFNSSLPTIKLKNVKPLVMKA